MKFDSPIYTEMEENLENITALYIRYSAIEKSKDTNAIKVQYDALKQYCSENNVQNPVVFIDDNFMGADGKRPAYQIMMEQLRNGKIKEVIVYSVDRISSIPTGVINFFKDCAKYKFQFFIMKEKFDSRDRETFNTILSALITFQNISKIDD